MLLTCHKSVLLSVVANSSISSFCHIYWPNVDWESCFVDTKVLLKRKWELSKGFFITELLPLFIFVTVSWEACWWPWSWVLTWCTEGFPTGSDWHLPDLLGYGNHPWFSFRVTTHFSELGIAQPSKERAGCASPWPPLSCPLLTAAKSVPSPASVGCLGARLSGW